MSCVRNHREDHGIARHANAILTFFGETLPKEWTTFRNERADNSRVMSHEGFRILEEQRY